MESYQDSLESYNIAQLHERLMQDVANFPSLEASANATHSLTAKRLDSKPPQFQPTQDAHGQPKIRHSSNTKIPRLKATESAPLMAFVDDSPSQGRDNALRPKSFHNFPAGYDGDTQPMPSQVYKDYNTKSMHMTMQKARTMVESYNDFTQYTSQQEGTVVEGESGHIDLMQHLRQSEDRGPHIQEISSDEDSDDERIGGGETQDLLSSVNRPTTFPKTPATAGRKRNHRGEPVSVASTRTPGSGLSAFGAFANAAPVMSASQMFNATQAVSSPLQDAPRSDPIFTRPSPNINHHSSPVINNFESPLFVSHAGQYRATTEPSDAYLAMEESHAHGEGSMARRRHSDMSKTAIEAKAEQRGESASPDQNDDDDDQDSAQLRLARKRQHALLSERALRSWDRVTAPQRISSRPKTVSPAYGRHVPKITFRRSASRGRDVIELPDDEGPADVDPMDEYDELAQEVRPSQRDDDWMDSDEAAQEDQDDREDDDYLDEPEPHPDDHPRQTSPQPEIQRSAPVDPIVVHHHDPADFSVADSQPGREDIVPPPFPVAPSSLSSVVPASQLPTATVPEQETVNSSSIPKPPPLTSQAVDVILPKPLPSSPPSIPSQDHEAAIYEPSVTVPLPISRPSRSMHVQNAETSASPLAVARLQSSTEQSLSKSFRPQQSSAIPETDPPEHDHRVVHSRHNTEPAASAQNTPDNTILALTGGVALTTFETAESGPNHPGAFASVPESPQKTLGILRFADFTTDPTPPDPLNDVDMDIDILTTEDKEYLNAMDSSASEPVNKRLRVYGRKGKRANTQTLRATMKSQMPNVQVLDDLVQEAAPGLSPSAVPEPLKNQAIALEDNHQSLVREEPTEAVTKDHLQSVETPKLLLEPPPVETEPSETPSAKAMPAPTTLPVVEEKQARLPSANLHAKEPTSMKSASNSEISSKKPGKLTRIRTKAYGKTAIRQTPKVANTRRNATEIAETPQANSVEVAQFRLEPDHKIEMRDAYDADASEAVVGKVDVHVINNEASSTLLASADLTRRSSSDVVVPERVFALFKGTPQAYYPATCLGASTLDGQQLRIRFDDGTTTQVEPHVVRRLELRRGDQVKADLPGLRSKVYIVTGFRDQVQSSSQEPNPKTDIHGFKAVQLTAKERDSLSSVPTGSAPASLTIPMTHLYLTHTMFVKFNDRPYTVLRTSAPGRSSRNQTPITEPVAPTTPGSRSRRHTLLTGGSTTRSDFASPLVSADGVFAGMAFAVSYSAKNLEKDRVIALIQQHGGLVLEQGFDELFNVLELSDSELSTPSKSKHRPSPAPTEDSGTDGIEALTLSARAKSLGFVALIADFHSRRAKYIQALALSLPCLSGRWVLDSAKAGAAAPWPKYLLPAGESVYLSGAVRSRTLASYDATTAKLTDTFRTRDRLLQGGRVLLVGQGGKAKWEARKAYAFLTIALGATNVRRVGSLEAAKRILEQEGDVWKWVYIDGKIEDAEKVLFGVANDGVVGTTKGTASRKRKRGDDVSDGKDKMVAGNGKVKIVGNEFVVQSLILGSLLEG